jgi:hypothetical protein
MQAGYHEVEVIVGDETTNYLFDLIVERYLVDAETIQQAITQTEQHFERQNTPYRIVRVTPSLIWGVIGE